MAFEIQGKLNGYKVRVVFGWRDAEVILPCGCRLVFDPHGCPQKPWLLVKSTRCPHYSIIEGATKEIEDPEEGLSELLPMLPSILEPLKRR